MRSLMEGRERQFELNKRWNQGSDEDPHWLHFQGYAISELDKNGQPAYVINAIHDLTHEMEEDKAARDLVHKYETLSNVPFVAMSFYDSKGFLLDLNDTMKRLCGITEENTELTRFWENVCMFDVALLRGVFDPNEREDSLFCQHMYYPEFDIDEYIECQIRPLFNADGEIVNYFINTFNRGDQESCFETIPHPAIENLTYGNSTQGMKFAFQQSTGHHTHHVAQEPAPRRRFRSSARQRRLNMSTVSAVSCRS